MSNKNKKVINIFISYTHFHHRRLILISDQFTLRLLLILKIRKRRRVNNESKLIYIGENKH